MKKITKTFEVYDFEELSKEVQEKLVTENRDINAEYWDWWSFQYEDAETIGLSIDEFDGYKCYINAKLIKPFDEVIELIKKNHGKDCDTYKIACKYKALEEHEEEFVKELSECYLKMITEHYEFITSDDCVIDTVRQNQFLKDGTIFED